jgi:adenine-specific DNA-methyltransferase
MQRLKLGTPDFVSRNAAEIARLFPNCVTETRDENGQLRYAIDFVQLQQELSGDVVAEPPERYHLEWPGKRKALLAANSPIARTLRPCRPESKDFDSTRNLFIEGNNLDGLKLLQETYLNAVKLIVIDPPYNRENGKDLIYKDDFSLTAAEYLVKSGQVTEQAERLVANTETTGRFHSDWLSMLYPRLRLARNLLTDDGVFMLHIDDNEVASAKLLLDEVFGQRNFLAILIWNKQHSQQQGLFKRYHEYVLVYGRNAACLDNIGGGDGLIDAGAIKKISRGNPASDVTFPPGIRFDAPDGFTLTGTYGDSETVTVVSGRLRASGGKTTEPVTLRAGWTQKRQMESWLAGNPTVDSKGQRVVEFYFNSAGKPKCIKERSKLTPPSILPEYGMVSSQTEYLRELMGEAVFPNPKPVQMLMDFVRWFTADGDIVLDFFAGSGTTAEAVMRQNALDGCRRRVVLMQLPEVLDPRNPEQRVAAEYCERLGRPANIAELSKERFRRAGAKLIAENPAAAPNLDTGFRVLKVDSSNMKDVYYVPGALRQQDLFELVDHVREDRTAEDLLFQVLLDWGVDLTLPIERELIEGKEVFFVDQNALAACFDRNIDEAVARKLAARMPLRVVFRDAGFASDSAKINVEQIFKQLAPGTELRCL